MYYRGTPHDPGAIIYARKRALTWPAAVAARLIQFGKEIVFPNIDGFKRNRRRWQSALGLLVLLGLVVGGYLLGNLYIEVTSSLPSSLLIMAALSVYGLGLFFLKGMSWHFTMAFGGDFIFYTPTGIGTGVLIALVAQFFAGYGPYMYVLIGICVLLMIGGFVLNPKFQAQLKRMYIR